MQWTLDGGQGRAPAPTQPLVAHVREGQTMCGVTDPSDHAGNRSTNRHPLPRSRPSDHGVDARAIDGLLDDVAAHDLELHSLMVLRHGAVVAEGWWAPYSAERKHLVYS